MTNNTEVIESFEVTIIRYLSVIWQNRKMIISITILGVIGAFGFLVLSRAFPQGFYPDYYTSKALILIDNQTSSGNSSGSVHASLTGVNLPVSSSHSDLAVFLISTNSVLDSIIESFKNEEQLHYYNPPIEPSRGMLRSKLGAEYSNRSGVLTVSFTHTNPVFARDVVNYAVASLQKRFVELGFAKSSIGLENLEANIKATNDEIRQLEEQARRLERSISTVALPGTVPTASIEMNRINLELDSKRQIHTQLIVQLELLKVNVANEKPIFQLLEPAEIPNRKSGPNRLKISIMFILGTAVFSIALAYLIHFISYVRNNPEIMRFLKG